LNVYGVVEPDGFNVASQMAGFSAELPTSVLAAIRLGIRFTGSIDKSAAAASSNGPSCRRHAIA
jgi:hypothetical protein